MKERQKEKMGVLPVTAEVVLWAEGILEKYRRAKVVLENRLKSDDRWYRMRHWEVIDELKETTGNRDVSSGGATGGVIAASAIAALQEAGSKLSRDCIQGSYRAAVKVCRMVIELVRQFYDLPRPFHVPDRFDTEYLTYSNALLNPHEEGYPHIPLFDVKVVCEKAPTYSRMSQNELALALYKAGLFSPDRREEALICLDMMDFDDKRFIMEKLRKGVDPILPPADAGEDDFSGGESAVTRAARLRVEEGLRV